MECRITSEFENRLRGGADSRALGRATASAWSGIVENLQPVIGVRGVESLARRCMFLAASQHPWLGEVRGPEGSTILAGPLAAAFEQQTPQEAAAGGAFLLNTLNELLASLVGASLTARLLQPVWNDFLCGTETQGGTA
ncbi:MAG: hypothetical protein EPO46_06735 [Lysobacter sp.]|nr:MAG: hypothetical protein EPO46_06735 [Lysobacter sp.]